MAIGGYSFETGFERDTCRTINDDPAIAPVTLELKINFCITGI
jgi:hypothetical protein